MTELIRAFSIECVKSHRRLSRIGTLLAVSLLFSHLNLFAAEAKLAKPPSAGIDAINAVDLREHLEFLSSDALGGRYTLAPNFAIAAEYLATRLKAYGYRGVGNKGSFFEDFELVTIKTDADKTRMSLQENGQKTELAYGDFYNAGTAGGNAQGELVFAGYGISAPMLKHDDYAGLDVSGKIVVVATGTPKGIDASAVTDSQKDEGAARAHGAVAILRLPSALYAAAMARPGFKERSLQSEIVRLAIKNSGQLLALRLSPATADKVLAPLGMNLEKLNALAKNGDALPVKSLGSSAEIAVGVSETRQTTQNVVGVLDGADPAFKDQYVTFSAHYDHLKTGRNGEIYHGADDDGSGTTAVLTIAHAMSLQRPKRSIFIIFHAGEELGLLGSEYNTDGNPAVPLDKLVVDLNIDMIGRSKPSGDTDKADAQLTDANTIYLIGANRISSELNAISEKTNSDFERLHFDYLLNDPNHPDRIYFRSDHWNYAKHGVPIIFYFDGVHVDYHKPTDTVDKIDFTKLTRVTRLVYETGWRIANLNHRLKRDIVAAD